MAKREDEALKLGAVLIPASYRVHCLCALWIILFLAAALGVTVILYVPSYIQAVSGAGKGQIKVVPQEFIIMDEIENSGEFAGRKDNKTYQKIISVSEVDNTIAIFFVTAAAQTVETTNPVQADLDIKTTYNGTFCGIGYDQETDPGSRQLKAAATCFVNLEGTKDFIVTIRGKNLGHAPKVRFSAVYISP